MDLADEGGKITNEGTKKFLAESAAKYNDFVLKVLG